MEEDIIDNMADEAKSVEELLGRYQQWPENGRSVARDVARRYLIIRDERDALKAELQQAREGLRQIADAAASAPFWILADMARAALPPPGQEA